MRASDALELELQMFVINHVGACLESNPEPDTYGMYLQVDISQKGQDNHDTFHRPKEPG